MNPGFLHRIRSHNRHALVAAFLSLVGAWLAWTIAYALCAAVTLGFLTIVHGQEVITGDRLMTLPWWLHPAALGVALVLLVWAAVDERRHRFHPAPDRQVVGWHLLGDVLLLPARLTFGVGHQLAARIRLSSAEKHEAYELLREIYYAQRAPLSTLGALVASPRHLRKLVLALQLAGWIDLLRTEDDWIYIIRSIEAEEVAGFFPAEALPE